MFEGMHGLKTGATDHVGEEMRKQSGWSLGVGPGSSEDLFTCSTCSYSSFYLRLSNCP